MFYGIGRLFTNYRIIHLQKLSTVNIPYTRRNILLNNFVRIKNQVRQKSVFQFMVKKSTDDIKRKDNVPDLFQLIYRNTMGKYLLGAQIFSTVLAGFVCVNLIVKSKADITEWKLSEDIWRKEVGYVTNEMYVYLTALIGFCVALQFMVARMPLRIYHYTKQKQYIMIFYGAFPGTTKRLTFNVCEIIKSQETGIMPWTDSSYEINDKSNVILIENYFRTPADLNIMLGYQKHPEENE